MSTETYPTLEDWEALWDEWDKDTRTDHGPASPTSEMTHIEPDYDALLID